MWNKLGRYDTLPNPVTDIGQNTASKWSQSDIVLHVYSSVTFTKKI